jgi:archaellum component FlaF (FlaF/FlaG flagellin family)
MFQKWLHQLRALPERTRFIIVGVIVFIVFLTGIFTYRFWGSWPKQIGNSSFLQAVSNTIGSVQNSFDQNAIQEAKNEINNQINAQVSTQTEAAIKEYAQHTTKLSAAATKNGVTVSATQLLTDPKVTAIWITIRNDSNETITLDPKTNFEMVSNEKTYLPLALGDSGPKSFFESGESTELLKPTDIAAGKALNAFIRFDTIPSPITLKLNLRNFFAEISRKKWDYLFDLSVKPPSSKEENTTTSSTQPRLPQE